MDATRRAQAGSVLETWPALPYEAWQETLDTLHMWTQMAGKVKLELVPFLNQWWEVAFTVTARGLTTGAIPYDHRIFQVDFDFLEHRLDIAVNRQHPRHPIAAAVGG
jgi:hypothetical protein